MKKFILALTMVALGGAAAMAQTAPTTPWSWQLQSGYSTSSKSLDSGWTGATSIGYQFTDAFKLSFDLGYFEGKIKDTSLKNHIWTFMVAPTYVYNISSKDQVYGFIGVGSGPAKFQDLHRQRADQYPYPGHHQVRRRGRRRLQPLLHPKRGSQPAGHLHPHGI